MRIESNYNYINPIRTLNTQQRFTFTSQPDKFVQATKAPAKKTVGKIRHFINNYLVKHVNLYDEPELFLKLANFMKHDSAALFNLYTRKVAGQFTFSTLSNLSDRKKAVELLADKPDLLANIFTHKKDEQRFDLSLKNFDYRNFYRTLKDHPEEYKKAFIDNKCYDCCQATTVSLDILDVIGLEENKEKALDEAFIKYINSGEIPEREAQTIWDTINFNNIRLVPYFFNQLTKYPKLLDQVFIKNVATDTLINVKNNLAKSKEDEAEIKKIEDYYIADLKSNIFERLSLNSLKEIKQLVGNRTEELKEIFLLKDAGKSPLQKILARNIETNEKFDANETVEMLKAVHNLFEKEPEFLVNLYLENSQGFKTLPLIEACSNRKYRVKFFKNIFDDIKNAKNIDEFINKLFDLERLYSKFQPGFNRKEAVIYKTLKKITNFLEAKKIKMQYAEKEYVSEKEVFKIINSLNKISNYVLYTPIDKNNNTLISRFADIIPNDSNKKAYQKALEKILQTKNLDLQQKDELGLTALEKILNAENEIFLDGILSKTFNYDSGLDIEYNRIKTSKFKEKVKKLKITFPDLYEAIELESRKAIELAWVQTESPFFNAKDEELQKIINDVQNLDLRFELKSKIKELSK